MLKIRLNLRKVAAILRRSVLVAACLAVTTMFSGCGKDDNSGGKPSAPLDFKATAGNGQVSLSWNAPASDGGSAITNYEVVKDNGKWETASSNSGHTFTGLTNDTEYAFKVRAVNKNGAGAEAADKATPKGTIINPPSAVQNLKATAGDKMVSLSWDEPVNGAPFTKFEASIGGYEWVTASNNTSHTFTGLTNNTEYTFSVRAVNAAGYGTPASVKATPQDNLKNIIIVPSGDMWVELGRTVILTVTVTPDDAANKSVTWSSLNTGIAVVNETGTITGVSEGKTTIRATAADGSGATADKNITVISGPMTGSGTLADPYIIRLPPHLDKVRDNLTAHYKLGNNVDLSGYLAHGIGYTKWGTRGWEPINRISELEPNTGFTGSFDGAGFKISGLWINRPREQAWIGLFSDLNTTWGVQNLEIEISAIGLFTSDPGSTISGSAGGVAATVTKGNITNCHVTGGKITGASFGSGGIAGMVDKEGKISNCFSTCAVGSNAASGGVVGYLYGSMTNCYSTGTINSNGDYAGGVAGSISSGSITNCYATGSVNSSVSYGFGGQSGGVVGKVSDGIITDCYATGAVSGVNSVGGVVGLIDKMWQIPSRITNCYATGAVSGTGEYIGGVVGYIKENGGTVTNCVALSPSVTTSKSTVNIGRVAGFVFDFNMLVNNFAQSNMTVTANGVGKTLIKAGNMLDGADCAATPAANWWTGASPNGPGWSSAVWNFTSGQLPKLK